MLSLRDLRTLVCTMSLNIDYMRQHHHRGALSSKATLTPLIPSPKTHLMFHPTTPFPAAT